METKTELGCSQGACYKQDLPGAQVHVIEGDHRVLEINVIEPIIAFLAGRSGIIVH